jgi:peptidoglycan/xylan/chitin deacetylase (PgdA/CDA1 family)
MERLARDVDGFPDAQSAVAGLAQGARAGRWRPSPLVAGSMGLHGVAALGALTVPAMSSWALAAVAANHAVLAAVGLWPRSCWLGPNLTRLPEASARRGEIAITFDDGPDPEVTPRVLEILETHGCRATFFCIAERAREHADLCREMARRGHGIENHSHGHRTAMFPWLSMGGFRREIGSAQAELTALTGAAPRFFRPPAGLRNPLLDPVLHELGLALVTWTRRGFDTVVRDPHAVAGRLVHGLAAGDILLLHDGHAARTARGVPLALEVLPRVLDAAREQALRPLALHDAIAS